MPIADHFDANFATYLSYNLKPRYDKVQGQINKVWSNLWDGGKFYWRLDVNSLEHEQLEWRNVKLCASTIFDPETEEELSTLEILASDLEAILNERYKREEQYQEEQRE